MVANDDASDSLSDTSRTNSDNSNIEPPAPTTKNPLKRKRASADKSSDEKRAKDKDARTTQLTHRPHETNEQITIGNQLFDPAMGPLGSHPHALRTHPSEVAGLEKRRKRQLSADRAVKRCLETIDRAIAALDEANRSPTPPRSFPRPLAPDPPEMCARCAKRGPDEKCTRKNAYVKCDYCRKSNKKCNSIPEKLWPTVRKLCALNKAARHSKPRDESKYKTARAAAKAFAKELDGLNRLIRKENRGCPVEKTVKDMSAQLRQMNQILLHPTCADMRHADPRFGVGSAFERRHANLGDAVLGTTPPGSPDSIGVQPAVEASEESEGAVVSEGYTKPFKNERCE
ncbi:hypothetical protein MMC07_000683 [Pseudocyphellaria aurata]|nr:hypothetical protein [Pseudocyphellaria aurata]